MRELSGNIFSARAKIDWRETNNLLARRMRYGLEYRAAVSWSEIAGARSKERSITSQAVNYPGFIVS